MLANIPDKLFFRIGEVAKLAALPPSTLRFWECEFQSLTPIKTKTGQRLYCRKDVELILQIKHLLHTEKLTIEGARRKLQVTSKRGGKIDSGDSIPTDIRTVINEVKADILSLSSSLSSSSPRRE